MAEKHRDDRMWKGAQTGNKQEQKQCQQQPNILPLINKIPDTSNYINEKNVEGMGREGFSISAFSS